MQWLYRYFCCPELCPNCCCPAFLCGCRGCCPAPPGQPDPVLGEIIRSQRIAREKGSCLAGPDLCCRCCCGVFDEGSV
ncbi:hypothetical protein Ciccas_014407, partial [Cichlidogyrus casuarinus]